MAAILTDLASELRRFADAVGAGDDRPGFAVIGGLAVSVRTEPRFTRDIDLAVACPADEDAEALLYALLQRGYRTAAVFEHTSGRMSTVRLVPPGGSEDGILVDLLFASSGIEAEIVADAEAIEVLPGVVLSVARIGHLLALKLLSVDERRPKDKQDLVALVAEADAGELQRCSDGIALVERRGYARGRDLHAAFSALRASMDQKRPIGI